MAERSLIFCAALAATLCLAPMIGQAQQAIEWDEKIYNPQPAEGDLILPMPCGGAMAFRRVDTPNTDGSIGDVAVTLGQQGSDLPYLDGLWRSYVSGAFSDGAASQRGYFFMAKYELSEAQYLVVMDEDCPNRVRRRLAVPQVETTKLDFERFAQRYTLWLMQTAPETLPAAGDTIGYLRLPIEEEWEFAARGGLAVDEAVFRAPLPATAEGESPNEYIAHGGSDSAGGKLQLIGTLKPNPLGLHDMLGNAAEIVGSPFSLVRHGRLHGQAGGYVKRGGDARTSLGQISFATRFELAPYDYRRGQLLIERYTGTRMVISGLSITSKAQNDQLIADLDRLAAPDPALDSAQSEAEVAALLQQMQRDAVSPREQSRLQIIADTLDAARAERNAQRDRSVRMILNSAVLLCNQAVQRYLNALFASLTVQHDLEELEAEARAAGDKAFLDEVLAAKEDARQSLERLGAKLDQDVVDYANLIEGLASEYSRELLNRQAEFIRPDHTRGDARRAACYGLLRTHMETRLIAGFSDTQLMRGDFEAVARSRLED